MEVFASLLQVAEALVEDRHRLLPGEVLVKEGEAHNTVYVLVQGALVVSRVLGREPTMLTTITNPGTVIGEMVSLGESVRTATITASEASELIALTPQEFDAVLAANPRI